MNTELLSREKAIEIAIKNGYKKTAYDYSQMPLFMGEEGGQADRFGLCSECNDGRKEAYNLAIKETRQGMRDVLMLLDADFWKCLGKGMDWYDNGKIEQFYKNIDDLPGWLFEWHNFIDYLAAGGKNIDNFFKNYVYINKTNGKPKKISN